MSSKLKELSDFYVTSDTWFGRNQILQIADRRDFKTCAEMVQQCIVVAHHLTKSMYPDLSEETHTFGQIRSKLTDQILSVCHLTKE